MLLLVHCILCMLHPLGSKHPVLYTLEQCRGAGHTRYCKSTENQNIKLLPPIQEKTSQHIDKSKTNTKLGNIITRTIKKILPPRSNLALFYSRFALSRLFCADFGEICHRLWEKAADFEEVKHRL